jgi:hypothetical protein
MTTEQLLELHDKTTAAARAIMRGKNQDYAGSDDALRNFRMAETLGSTMLSGVVLRLGDKVSRLSRAAVGTQLTNETVRDTILDIINYAVIALAIYQEEEEVRYSYRGIVGKWYPDLKLLAGPNWIWRVQERAGVTRTDKPVTPRIEALKEGEDEVWVEATHVDGSVAIVDGVAFFCTDVRAAR